MRRQPRRRNPRYLIALWFPALVLVVGLATQVSLAPDRPEAVVGEFDLEVGDGLWTSDPVEVDATAVGLSWEGNDVVDAWVQASEDGETWGPWTAVHDPDDHGPDAGSSEAVGSSRETSEAVYVGKASWLRFRVAGAPDDLRVTYVETTGRHRTLWEKASSVVDRLRFFQVESAAAAPDQPAIRGRSAWGGDACLAQHPDPHPHVHYADRVQTLFVHHTIHGGGANSYTAAEAPELIYAICIFHTQGRGWDDIAYNVLIDKFGTVWEGRAGGLAEGVIGAHTGGFNSNSTGVAFVGDHRWTPPTTAAQNAFVGYAAWKLDVHHIDPLSSALVESLGSTLFEEGVGVNLKAISAHRAVSSTSCPGDATHLLIPQWRQAIAQTGGAKIYGGWPELEPIPGFEETGYQPTVFPLRFTEEMAWIATIHDADGLEVARFEGVGTEASPVWDGVDALGERRPFGDYRMRVSATPTSGAPSPRPVDQRFQLGSYNPPFSDDDESIHEDDIRAIFEEGITNGCDLELFCPGKQVLRWQMALFLNNLHTAAGYELPLPVDQGFTDTVHLPIGYREAIDRLAQLGITAGTGAGTFTPEGAVPRWQMAVFLTRHIEVAGLELPDPIFWGFTDIGHLLPEYQDAIHQMAQLGITTGTGATTFDPEAFVTREQMATFLARTLTIVRPTPTGNG